MIELLGNLVILGGAVFLFAAGLGVLRMPDSYNRIQTGTKASTLGTILVLIGLCFHHPDWIGKMLLLVFFVLLTNPISSHALARASHSRRIPRSEKTVVDRLEELENRVEEV
ncbi:MAG: monovalent cation/H(+) antiporter subunit G [Chromatiaceae bacterium]|nr:monovalent cation/H(+) antiporter subunit G [Gammaproteobacteria bacterium]MCP5306457.1 monovalent cation/H(+) antiporter subunit G [Chromatiaceae bacterium]MCP5312009.1 monovalent cation/H(+) antiporter subunit G [Chromatiaceae bacterium]